MAAIKFQCPKCGAKCKADESQRGKRVRCPKPDCAHVFRLAGPEAGAPKPAAAGTSIPRMDSGAAPVPAANRPDDRRPRGDDGIPLEWKPGDVILDLYEVKDILGQGGMGTVFLVHHRGWNIDLAVKSPRPNFLSSAEKVANFEREAEVWANLGLHPHTVSCFYVRRLGGIPRVFAEYVEGGSLRDWIEDEDRKLYHGGPKQALARVLDIAIQFAWGLHYAHEQGLIHQDIKPDNVMMTVDGTVKVTDFGLAKARAAASEDVMAGQSVLVTAKGGTLAYRSPEQAKRERLSRKTDIWSWAVSVLDLFVGEVHRGYGPEALKLLEMYLAGGPPESFLPQMPHGLGVLLRKCFARDPNSRPQDCLALVPGLLLLYRQGTGKPYPREQPDAGDLLVDGLNNRAVSLYELDEIHLDQARAIWEKAAQYDPFHPEVRYNLLLADWRAGSITDKELLKQLEVRKSTYREPWRLDYHLALIHLERGDIPSATEILERLRNPSFAENFAR